MPVPLCPLRERLGALRERVYGLLFGGDDLGARRRRRRGRARIRGTSCSGSGSRTSRTRSARFVLTPVGTAVAGPVAVALGGDGALWLAAAAAVPLDAAVLSVPSAGHSRAGADRRGRVSTMAAS